MRLLKRAQVSLFRSGQSINVQITKRLLSGSQRDVERGPARLDQGVSAVHGSDWFTRKVKLEPVLGASIWKMMYHIFSFHLPVEVAVLCQPNTPFCPYQTVVHPLFCLYLIMRTLINLVDIIVHPFIKLCHHICSPHPQI